MSLVVQLYFYLLNLNTKEHTTCNLSETVISQGATLLLFIFCLIQWQFNFDMMQSLVVYHVNLDLIYLSHQPAHSECCYTAVSVVFIIVVLFEKFFICLYCIWYGYMNFIVFMSNKTTMKPWNYCCSFLSGVDSVECNEHLHKPLSLNQLMHKSWQFILGRGLNTINISCLCGHHPHINISHQILQNILIKNQE